MFRRDSRDRGALAALGMLIVAIVATQLFARGNLSTIGTLAEWLAVMAAIGSVLVSVWAVRLVAETLRETRRTADAAVASNETNKEIGRDQSRAYLHVDQALIF